MKLERQLTNSSISSIKSIAKDSDEYHILLEIQDRLWKLYEQGNNMFDATDVTKIIMSKTYLRRFAHRKNGNVDKTVEMVKNTLIWRKENKVPQITEKSIPKEFYDLGMAFMQGTDSEGNYIMHVRAKFAAFNEKVTTALHRYFAYFMFKCVEDSMNSGNGWTLCADLTGISITQCDLPELLWAIRVAINYMPAGLKSIIIYNLPWFAKPFAKAVLAFVPAEWKEIIHIVDHKELLKLIPKENIPRYIDYPKEPYSAPAPPNVKPLEQTDTTPLDTNKEDLIDFFRDSVLIKK